MRNEYGSILVEKIENGSLWRVILGGSKGNIIDARMTESLTAVIRDATKSSELKALSIEGADGHFSFGASVEEHLPEHVAKMIRSFDELFVMMLESSVFLMAAVRGQCLGGGLELASFCHRVFASPEAKLGQPEIRLGVFAPIASVILKERVGRRHAEDLCITGRSVTASEAYAIGLVDVLAENPTEAALAYAREHLLPRSASSLRHAVKAARYDLSARLAVELKEIERIYLEELMATHDAVEGIRAFLEKRAPEWQNR